MKNHHGTVIELMVRRREFNVSKLAKELNVSRRSVYNYFQSDTIKPDIIFSIGKIIGYDFSKDLPELLFFQEIEKKIDLTANSVNTEPYSVSNRDLYKLKYIDLLERYNNLLLERKYQSKRLVNY